MTWNTTMLQASQCNACPSASSKCMQLPWMNPRKVYGSKSCWKRSGRNFSGSGQYLGLWWMPWKRHEKDHRARRIWWWWSWNRKAINSIRRTFSSSFLILMPSSSLSANKPACWWRFLCLQEFAGRPADRLPRCFASPQAQASTCAAPLSTRTPEWR